MDTWAGTTLSVVVCCYTEERWDLLRAAIDSIQAQERPVDEIIVVVDHNDLLLGRLRSNCPLGVTIVENDDPPGLSGARNAGVRAATGDVVAFLDDDAEATPSWSTHLMNPYRDADVIGVGGRVVPRFESGSARGLPPELHWIVGCTYAGFRPSRGPVRNFIGANMSLRRSVVEAVGGFDCDLGRRRGAPAGCEETDLCIRATGSLGGAMFYEPDALVTHFVPEARTTPEYLRARCFAEGVSKATIRQVAGRRRGLESERAYVRRVLPSAFVREIAAAVLRRRDGAWLRARAIAVALLLAVAGYVWGRLTLRRRKSRADERSPFEPACVVVLDVDAPDVFTAVPGPSGRSYRRALALVRERNLPLGLVELPLSENGVVPDQAAQLLSNVRARVRTTGHRSSLSLMHHPLVSIIVATHNRPESLAQTLDSIWQLEYSNYEVIVVDNASRTRETREVVATLSAAHPQVRYVREPRAGLARAHNRGLQHATGSIVAFTDDDVVVDRRWLDEIVGAFEEHPGVGCVTGLILPLELETPEQELMERAAGFGKGFDRQLFDGSDPPGDDPLFPLTAGRFGSGANMAFRADVIRESGGFDPALGAGTPARGGDDLAAFYDVVTDGWCLVYEPAAIVFHAHPRDAAGLDQRAFSYGVGLAAYGTHVLSRSARDAGGVARQLRRALTHLFAPSSPKNARRPPDYPRRLVRRELTGIAIGPWCYLRSRHASRHDDWAFDPVVAPAEPAARLEA